MKISSAIVRRKQRIGTKGMSYQRVLCDTGGGIGKSVAKRNVIAILNMGQRVHYVLPGSAELLRSIIRLTCKNNAVTKNAIGDETKRNETKRYGTERNETNRRLIYLNWIHGC